MRRPLGVLLLHFCQDQLMHSYRKPDLVLRWEKECDLGTHRKPRIYIIPFDHGVSSFEEGSCFP